MGNQYLHIEEFSKIIIKDEVLSKILLIVVSKMEF